MMVNKIEVKPDQNLQEKSLRLWPGIVLVVFQWLSRFVMPAYIPETTEIAILSGLAGWLLIMLWWAFFSRATRLERFGGAALMLLLILLMRFATHASISTGMQGMMFAIYATPVLSLAVVVWAIISSRFSVRTRRMGMVLTILLACGVWTLLRSNGISGEGAADFTWRWAQTDEEILMAETGVDPVILAGIPDTSGITGEWPGFRGPDRDGVVHGIRIATDWSVSPPVKLWQRLVGPGCSSCAVRGARLYTQEQRGENEVVTCYDITSGKLLWRYDYKARFWDSHAGAGPRGTPALYQDRVYTLGATGIVTGLSAKDGSFLWSRDAAQDLGVTVPEWGISSSPLVVDNMVIVALTGTMIAYDCETGEQRWKGPDGGLGYSSPHLLTLDGVRQVVLMSEVGATSVQPENGIVIWQYPWKEERIVQPAMTSDGDLLLSREAKGMRRLKIALKEQEWNFEERWTSSRLRPVFNDIVVHKGYAYSYNNLNLVCINIENGERMWLGERYGGQILLLADQDLLLILTEDGELVLGPASPEPFTELASIDAIDGKTWNHPVLAGNLLVVRNAREMAVFRLPVEKI